MACVRSGHQSIEISWRDAFYAAGVSGIYYSSSAGATTNRVNYLTVDDLVSKNTYYDRYWGFPLRCLAIE